MSETTSLGLLIWAFTAGIILGTFFFGGLWLTVRKGISSTQTAFCLLGSKLLRMGGTIAGFYFVGAGNWQRMLVCLIGFVIARTAVFHLIGQPRGSHES